MAEFSYVACPSCKRRFMIGEEFFRIPESYCLCPFCKHEFAVYGSGHGSAAPSRLDRGSRSG